MSRNMKRQLWALTESFMGAQICMRDHKICLVVKNDTLLKSESMEV